MLQGEIDSFVKASYGLGRLEVLEINKVLKNHVGSLQLLIPMIEADEEIIKKSIIKQRFPVTNYTKAIKAILLTDMLLKEIQSEKINAREFREITHLFIYCSGLMTGVFKVSGPQLRAKYEEFINDAEAKIETSNSTIAELEAELLRIKQSTKARELIKKEAAIVYKTLYSSDASVPYTMAVKQAYSKLKHSFTDEEIEDYEENEKEIVRACRRYWKDKRTEL